jgi:hypothetical protein
MDLRRQLWPPGMKSGPPGKLCLLMVKLSPGGEILCLPLHLSKHSRVFTTGGEQKGEHPSRIQSSPRGAKFTPRIQSSPLGANVSTKMKIHKVVTCSRMPSMLKSVIFWQSRWVCLAKSVSLFGKVGQVGGFFRRPRREKKNFGGEWNSITQAVYT